LVTIRIWELKPVLTSSASRVAFLGGLSIEEPAEVLKVSTGTVMRDWPPARAWLGYTRFGPATHGTAD
jgi:hypothetical protein